MQSCKLKGGEVCIATIVDFALIPNKFKNGHKRNRTFNGNRAVD